MKMINARDFYKTSDLPLAATIALDRGVEAVDMENPRRAYFMFRRDSRLDETVEAYFRGELRVEPNRYFAQVKALKARLYAD